jgi:hypothetical protein
VIRLDSVASGPACLKLLVACLVFLVACSGDRAGWAPRGSYYRLHESPSIQVRRGSQYVDPATGDLVVHWVGARAPEGQPEILGCGLVVFDDRDGDRRPDPGEALCGRESLAHSRKVLFDDVRVRPPSGSRLRVRLDVRTEAETSGVVWDLVPD